MSIQFNDKKDVTTVKLEGRLVGHIRRASDGKWRYCPVGASSELCGRWMLTRDAVKRSLTSNS